MILSAKSNYYYSVAIAQKNIWAQNYLVYSYSENIPPGTIAEVPFGRKKTLGVVLKTTQKPKNTGFTTKNILTKTDFCFSENTLEFYKWLDYYPAQGAGHLYKFIPSHLKVTDLDKSKIPKPPQAKNLDVDLNPDQQSIVEEINQNPKKSIIIHGITGSGKTRIYLKVAQQILKNHQNVLLIVPEISLTTPIQQETKKYFKNHNVLIYHSTMTESENRKTWLAAIQSDQPNIFIGTRSSLFLPFKNLGLVVVDEAHDTSLKENHEASRYHGLVVAAALAKNHQARLIIGSATPPINETYLMLQKKAKLLCNHNNALKKPAVRKYKVVDVRDKNNVLSKSPLISKPLYQQIKQALVNKEQALIFINKLGTAHLATCNSCGWQANCPNCDKPYIYHHDKHNYQCNVCGQKQSAAASCPECNKPISIKSLAIKSIQQEIKKLFPTAKIARFDSSNTKKESINKLYESVHNGEYDILIGTQMMSKGFDLPHLAVVGVINADSLLNLPDINSEEKMFQQIVQVAGRVGRGHRDGCVILQTRQPANPTLQLALKNDWHELYETVLGQRRKSNFPPFVHLAKISIQGSSDLIAQRRAREVYSKINSSEIVSSEPFPAFHHKVNRKYYWQILCKTKKRRHLQDLATKLNSKYVTVDLEPVTLL